MDRLRDMIKIGDVLLIALLGVLCLMSFVRIASSERKGHWVIVSVEDKEISHHSLAEDRIVEVDGPLGTTRVQIEDGFVWVTASPCPHKTCMRMGHIRYAGEILVCLPNRVLVRVDGEKRGEIDGITM
jgi:hypothetical protein